MKLPREWHRSKRRSSADIADARAEIVQLEHDAKSGRLQEEVLWHDSYVAEQHVQHYGKSSAPVCWSVVGYTSGFASACLGQEIYFQERECLAQGEAKCTVVGKDAESWGDELEIGFIGCEVAASLRQKGVDVVCIGRSR